VPGADLYARASGIQQVDVRAAGQPSKGVPPPFVLAPALDSHFRESTRSASPARSRELHIGSNTYASTRADTGAPSNARTLTWLSFRG